MADDIPITEVRRVLIQFEIAVPNSPMRAPDLAAPQPSLAELARAVKDELIRDGSRNPNIFGGRA